MTDALDFVEDSVRPRRDLRQLKSVERPGHAGSDSVRAHGRRRAPSNTRPSIWASARSHACSRLRCARDGKPRRTCARSRPPPRRSPRVARPRGVAPAARLTVGDLHGVPEAQPVAALVAVTHRQEPESRHHEIELRPLDSVSRVTGRAVRWDDHSSRIASSPSGLLRSAPAFDSRGVGEAPEEALQLRDPACSLALQRSVRRVRRIGERDIVDMAAHSSPGSVWSDGSSSAGG